MGFLNLGKLFLAKLQKLMTQVDKLIEKIALSCKLALSVKFICLRIRLNPCDLIRIKLQETILPVPRLWPFGAGSGIL